jgi:hypothetical protein
MAVARRTERKSERSTLSGAVRKWQGVLHLIPSLFLVLLTPVRTDCQTRNFQDDFQHGHVDRGRWTTTSDGDFRERTVDVIEVAPRDFRLRLRADTRGTRADTVKFVGARTADEIRFIPGTTVAVELDWNEQVNGSYLSAALVLSPEKTSGNPLRGPDWIKVEYVGVPPGRNARMVVAIRVDSREKQLFTEGWPETNRRGRKITRQKVQIELLSKAVRVWENGSLMFESSERLLSFDSAFLYLQMSSHSNYPPREVYFDDVEVTEK